MEHLMSAATILLEDPVTEPKLDSRVRAAVASVTKVLFGKVKTILASCKETQFLDSLLQKLKDYDAQSHRDKITKAESIQNLCVSYFHYNSYAFFKFLIEDIYGTMAAHSEKLYADCVSTLKEALLIIRPLCRSGTFPKWMEQLVTKLFRGTEREEEEDNVPVRPVKRGAPEDSAAPPSPKRTKHDHVAPLPSEDIYPRELTAMLGRYQRLGCTKALDVWQTIVADVLVKFPTTFDHNDTEFSAVDIPSWAPDDHALFRIDAPIRISLIQSAIKRGATFESTFVNTRTMEGVTALMMSTASSSAPSDFSYDPETGRIKVAFLKIPVML